MSITRRLIIQMVCWAALAAWTAAEPPPLIPRAELFAPPQRLSPRISPDGSYLAYLAPYEGVMNIWIRTIGEADDRPVTRDSRGGIPSFQWAWDSRYIFFLQDPAGEGQWHVQATDFQDETRQIFDMTPLPGVAARFIAASPRIPNKILIGLNVESPDIYDVYELDFVQGKLKLHIKNPGGIVHWVVDDRLQVLGGTVIEANGGGTLIIRRSPEDDWHSLLVYGPDDIARFISFAPGNQSVYVVHNMKTEYTGLYRIHLAGPHEESVFTGTESDLDYLLLDVLGQTPLAVTVHHLRHDWKVLSPAVKDDLEAIRALGPGDFDIISRDADDNRWILAHRQDNVPLEYFVFYRATKTGVRLFSQQPDLAAATLSLTQPYIISARDGKDLVAYLTLPQGIPARNLPMVVVVHGGPWDRDEWGFNPLHQWLANRGYAVLAVNYRGSTGLGKSHLTAGHGQWGDGMLADLADATGWAIREGFADKARVGIMGTSFGGYAALMSVVRHPDIYCCAVDIVGYKNLLTLIDSIPAGWTPMRNMFRIRVGDWEKVPDFFRENSPVTQAAKIRPAVLIAQGARDTRVRAEEARRTVQAIRQAGGTVTYLEFSDEGHEFGHPTNRLALYAAVEDFLAERLGGRSEPAAPSETSILDQARAALPAGKEPEKCPENRP
ncbi:MAG: S9 family peptidase [Acidobacteria bacterium]|nr:S9 family peptidase [Acidobacteriota bacterium]